MSAGMFDRQSAIRIAAAVAKSELPDPVELTSDHREPHNPPAIRCVLLEPLYGHSSALAIRTRLAVDHAVQEIQIVGLPDENGRFRLSLTWNRVDLVSDWIPWNASAAEVYQALQSWPFASGDLFVGLGRIDPDEVPAWLPTPAAALPIARWTISFVGPQFDGVPVPPLAIHSDTLGGVSLAIAYSGSWISTGQIVQVRECGFIADNPASYAYTTRRTPYPAGAAVGCVWMPDAQSYCVWPVEVRKFAGPT